MAETPKPSAELLEWMKLNDKSVEPPRESEWTGQTYFEAREYWFIFKDSEGEFGVTESHLMVDPLDAPKHWIAPGIWR